MIDAVALRARLADVRSRIERAAGRVGRDPASIRLVAVSKTFPADHVRALADAGQVDFGENKVQEALQKMDQLADLALRWHLLGHLQSNKAKKAGRFDVVHSIDGAGLIGKLDEAAAAADRQLEMLYRWTWPERRPSTARGRRSWPRFSMPQGPRVRFTLWA